MVIYRPYRFTLQKKEIKNFTLQAACLNPERNTPTDLELFSGVAKTTDQVIAFLARAVDQDRLTIQAGIWAIISSYTAADIQARARSNTDPPTPAISSAHIKRAKLILDEMQIPNRL